MEYVELNLSLSTPFLPGSADANKVDLDWPLRPSEVKGIWRWWARALVAGVLFNKGLLHGKTDRYIVKYTSREEALCISRITGIHLGLGYAGKDGAKSSCFKIIINPNTQQSPQQINPSLANQLQRIKLLLRGKSVEYFSNASIKLKINNNIPCNLGEASIEASISALALAFKYSCFGKGGRRGLGCFNITSHGQYSRIFLMSDQELINTAVDNVSKVVDYALEQGECNKLKKKNVSNCELPPMPVISKNLNYINCIDHKEASDIAGMKSLSPYNLFTVKGDNLLSVLHNFFLRTNRIRKIPNDELSTTFNAWILGLPRAQKRRRNAQKRTSTGYLISGNINRRASPIIIAIHNNEAYISVFTSADWPRELIWRGSHGKPINVNVNESRIIEATSIALQELKDY
ncbi:RAMP superfamily CRISPR-associated protein, partial [Caldivirga sp. UBA161]|uniref:RAMP superfamily CRISPR-associated protein n=1 Tax=Caldivirga sp. UBA161 TaxID=1915569 RepID=UPI0025BEF347